MAVFNRFKEQLIKKMERENRIITEAQAARELEVPRQTVNLWVQQKRNPMRELERVCRYMPCEPGDLLYLDPPLKTTDTPTTEQPLS